MPLARANDALDRLPGRRGRVGRIRLLAQQIPNSNYLLYSDASENMVTNALPMKNGDKIVRLNGGKIEAFGVLHSATPGNDYCNGNIAVTQSANEMACMVDCLHLDDVAALMSARAASIARRRSFPGARMCSCPANSS